MNYDINLYFLQVQYLICFHNLNNWLVGWLETLGECGGNHSSLYGSIDGYDHYNNDGPLLIYVDGYIDSSTDGNTDGSFLGDTLSIEDRYLLVK